MIEFLALDCLLATLAEDLESSDERHYFLSLTRQPVFLALSVGGNWALRASRNFISPALRFALRFGFLTVESKAPSAS